MAFNLPMSDDEGTERARSFVRYPKNAPGPFYVVDGECMCSGLAPAEAPELISWDSTSPDIYGNEYHHCYFGRQPETPDEIERAIRAIAVSEADAIRYGGDDFAILQRLSDLGLGRLCDHSVPPPRPNPGPFWPLVAVTPQNEADSSNADENALFVEPQDLTPGLFEDEPAFSNRVLADELPINNLESERNGI